MSKASGDAGGSDFRSAVDLAMELSFMEYGGRRNWWPGWRGETLELQSLSRFGGVVSVAIAQAAAIVAEAFAASPEIPETLSSNAAPCTPPATQWIVDYVSEGGFAGRSWYASEADARRKFDDLREIGRGASLYRMTPQLIASGRRLTVMPDYEEESRRFDPAMAKAVAESFIAAVHKWRSFATKGCPRCGGRDLGCVFAQNPEGRRFHCNGCGHDGPLGICFEEAGKLWDEQEVATP